MPLISIYFDKIDLGFGMGWLRPIPQWVSCAVCVRTTSAVPMSRLDTVRE